MKRIFTACFILSACGQAWAGISASPLNSFSFHRTYIGGGVGIFSPSVDTSHYVSTGPGWPDDHYISRSITNQSYLYLTGGYSWERPGTWLPSYSLGLKYMYVPTMTVKGYIDQYSLPGFNNYSYSYDNKQQNLLAIAKGNLIRWHDIMPYLMAGAGLSMNTISSYTETPASGITPRVSPGFASHTNYNLAYTLGAGIDYALRNNLWINIEYSYSDFGNISTGQGANYTNLSGYNFSNATLKNKLTATSATLGVTYYIG